MNGTLAPNTKIQVGLAVTLCAAAGGLYLQVYNLGTGLRQEMSILAEKVDEKYISRDLFTSEIQAMKRENELNVRMLDARVSEVKSAVAALQASQGR